MRYTAARSDVGHGEDGAPIDAVGEGADEGAEEQHGGHAQESDESDEERRFGEVVDVDAECDGLEPTHDVLVETPMPQSRA